MHKNILLFIVISLFKTSYSKAHEIVILNQYNQPVSNAHIIIQSETDASNYYDDITDINGQVRVDIKISENRLNKFDILTIYPNPFNNDFLVYYAVDKKDHVLLSLSELSGRKLYEIDIGMKSPGEYYYIWNNSIQNMSDLKNGIYILQIKSGRKSSARLLYKNSNVYATPTEIPGFINDSSFVQKEKFTVSITAPGYDTVTISNYRFHTSNKHVFSLISQIETPFKTGKKYFYKWNGTDYDSIFIKGINLGVSIPNTAPGELAASFEQYNNWILRIAETGFNCIRVYTLHYPRFYEALYNYNITHPHHPVYLFQGIWLDEFSTDTFDLFSQTDAFSAEIESVVKCIHGDTILYETEERFGKATGEYTKNVAQWLIGYIIGREIHPFTVQTTNKKHPDINRYSGNHISINDVSATESWLTQHMDGLISFEHKNYNTYHPVSFSNWTTLDPLEHPSEDDTASTEDIVSVDLGNIDILRAPAGIFASYHAYPYFPDFINRDPMYLNYTDSKGANSYLGYLHHLKNHYKNMPLLIAEFGVPTSWGNAHFSKSGMDHGGMTETEQGIYALRMYQNMYDSKCAGGLLFSWIDEWFKTAWITQEFEGNVSGRIHWNNKLNPEQNFGLVSFESLQENLFTDNKISSSCGIKGISVDKDDAFLYLKIETNATISNTDNFNIAFDTYDPDLGESLLLNGKKIKNRAEFLLEFNTDSATFYVTQAYDLFAIWFGTSTEDQLYHSIASDKGDWEIFRIKNNFEEDAIDFTGKLQINQNNVLNAVSLENNEISIRIPWGMMHFFDPTKRLVVDDNRETPQRETRKSNGIVITIFYNDCKYVTPRIKWAEWDYLNVKEREKKSLHIIEEGIQTIGF